ncbi:hypothetical protein [Caballeronia sordidicola]|uniref:hypothetical protein n=1 Tax=Caballeronia sordidicola TaxID=196367 RepID=UPI0004CFEBE8|nr:hypothetical protein [Caballeronia sordidicola]
MFHTEPLMRPTQLLRSTRSSHSGCQAGFKDGYDIALPTTAEGVYTMSYFPADPEADRTLHIDRYSGQIPTMLIVWLSDRLLFSPGKVVDTR